MLFDLYDTPKKEEYDLWFKRVYFVSSVLSFDYFKLWELPEYEFNLLEAEAIKIQEARKKRQEEILNNK